MLYSYKWLQELSQTKKSPKEVADLLIAHSFEVEDITEQGEGLDDVVIGHVIAKEKHPDADKLNVVSVDVGEERLQIVCGAPNISEGQRVPVALVGAVLPGNFEIKQAKIRGVESVGMICAEDELGLGTDHDGIMILGEDAPVGEKIIDYLGLDDTVLDIDVLPNRAHDALSHRGMAREIAMLEERVLTFDETMPADDAGIAVEVETPACSRYSATSITGVEVGPSPLWLVQRLKSLGHGSYNNVVDITNYIMLETGQPLHAFSADFVPKVIVRKATDREQMTLIDKTEVSLSKEDIVITDGEKPIALAGVMGGKGSAITDATVDIVLEAASFSARAIRATKSRHGLMTDAAYRFERDLDPNLTEQAAARAKEMIQELAGGKVVGVTDTYPQEQKISPWSIALEHASVERLLGIEIDTSHVRKILEGLNINVKQKNDVYLCHIPTYRRDLGNAEDLIEEIGRIYGYQNIHARPLVENVQVPQYNAQRFFERSTKDNFAKAGFDEVRSYSFYSDEDTRKAGVEQLEHVILAGGGDDASLRNMRRTLAVGLLHSAGRNQAYDEQTAIFETGRLYQPQKESGLPQEMLMLGIAVTSKKKDADQFYRLKGALETYLTSHGVRDVLFAPIAEMEEVGDDAPHLFHPSRRAKITLQDGMVIGMIGEVSKKAAKAFGIKNARTAYAQIDLDRVRKEARQDMTYESLQKYPSVMRDISIKVDAQTLVADVERSIYAAGSDLLVDVDLFDLYTNTKTAERSVAFHLIFQSNTSTLTTDQIDPLMAKIIQRITSDGWDVKGE